MATKPITVTRIHFMDALANLINSYDLPAFVKLEVIERLKSQLENLVQAEYERDIAAYRAELAKEQADSDSTKEPTVLEASQQN